MQHSFAVVIKWRDDCEASTRYPTFSVVCSDYMKLKNIQNALIVITGQVLSKQNQRDFSP